MLCQSLFYVNWFNFNDFMIARFTLIVNFCNLLWKCPLKGLANHNWFYCLSELVCFSKCFFPFWFCCSQRLELFVVCHWNLVGGLSSASPNSCHCCCRVCKAACLYSIIFAGVALLCLRCNWSNDVVQSINVSQIWHNINCCKLKNYTSPWIKSKALSVVHNALNIAQCSRFYYGVYS